MWMVWCHDDGLVIITENKELAEQKYEETKKWYKDSFDGEFTTDEHVVLAKVEKQFYSHDTGEEVFEEDEDGNEVETIDTYWGWNEDTF
jgi:hypothetical protein